MGSEAVPRHDAYDVVVIGAGLGGLATAACLAKLGRKVLVAERLDGPGGSAHSFDRGPYRFDPAIHWSQQGRDEQLMVLLLNLLGVRGLVDLIPVDTLYAARFPDLTVYGSSNPREFAESHIKLFPHEAQGIARFIQVAEVVTRESQQVPPTLGLQDLDEAVGQFPNLFKYRMATVGQVLDECLDDPRAKAALGASWPYLGLPPSQLSFLTWAAIMMAMFDAAIYCGGSFQKLADAFVAALERDGGELVCNSPVTRVSVSGGKVTGVTLEGGREIQAAAVVSNADAHETMTQLIGEEHLPASYLRRMGRLNPSLSACVLFVATDLDLTEMEPAHETFVFNRWDHDATLQDILAGKLGGAWASVPSLLDPTVAPAGEHLIVFTTLAPYDVGRPWEEAKEWYTEALLDQLNEIFPGVRDRLTYTEVATPLTLERYLHDYKGAIYGWSNTPSQATTQRLSHVTPISGLYLSGHWTQPGTGSFRVIYSGLQTAQIMMDVPNFGQFLGMLGAGPPPQ